MELTDKEINIKIAKAHGYTEKDEVWSRPPDKAGTIVSGPFERIVPNWAGDENKAIELCRTEVKDKERIAYMAELNRITSLHTPEEKQDSFTKQWNKINATSQDRCLAWLYLKKILVEAPPLKEVA